jgi:WD40 repeat protein
MIDGLDLAGLDALLHEQGPEAVEAALRPVGGPAGAAVAAAAHLLRPIHPARARTDVLLSRLALHPALAEAVEDYASTLPARLRLRNRRVPAPHPALRRVLTEPGFSAIAVAIEPGGQWLATGGYLGCARTWDPATGRVRTVMTGHPNGVIHVAIAPGGDWLATGGADGTVRIWDAAAGGCLAVLSHAGPEQPQFVDRVAIAPDGAWLAAASHDGTVRIWEVAAGALRATLAGPEGLVDGLAITADGGRLTAATNSGNARTWDTATWQELKGYDEPVLERAPGRAIAPDGSWVAIAEDERYVRIYDAAALDAEPAAEPGVVTVDRDGWLAARDGLYSFTAERVCAAGTGEVVWSMPDRVRFGAAAADRTWLAVLDGRTLRIWDPVTGTDRAAFTGGGLLLGAAVAPDATWLAVWSYRTVELWDLAGNRLRATVKASRSNVTGVRIAPDGTWLAVLTSDRKVRIVDAATGGSRKLLKGEHTRARAALDIAPHGAWLAVASEGCTVRLFDAVTGKERLALGGHTEPVTAVAVAPGGAHVAAVDGDGTLLVWETVKGALAAAMRADVMALDGCAWLPGGDICVTGAGQSMVYTFTA